MSRQQEYVLIKETFMQKKVPVEIEEKYDLILDRDKNGLVYGIIAPVRGSDKYNEMIEYCKDYISKVN